MPRISNEKVELIIKMYKYEKNISEITRSLGFHKKTIVYYLKQRGIYVPNVRHLTDEEKSLVVDLYLSGESCFKISKSLNLTEDLVYNHIKRVGIVRKPTIIDKSLTDACISDYLDNMRVDDIAIKHNVCTATVRKIIKTNNIKRASRICKRKHENGNWIERIALPCSYCGKIIERERRLVERRSNNFFCSIECKKFWAMENQTGKNNPNYRDGNSYGDYCEKFNAHFKRRVRDFFGNTCILCGKTKEDNNNKNMDVHHVHGNKLACCKGKNDIVETDKFVALCASCHSKIRNSDYYRDILLEIINSKYNGKCFYTKDEWKNIMLGRK